MVNRFVARSAQRGFTLVELVMVIGLLGVISGMVMVFMKSPIDAYFASARRAGVTDVADTAARRMSRDIRRALPNSVRSPNSQCLEFIPTKTGGRYRVEALIAGDGTNLDFTIADSAFNLLGSNAALPADQRIGVGDLVVVYNLGVPGADAYNQDNTSDVIALGAETSAPVEAPIQFTARKFPLESPARRVHVVPKDEKVVAYVCSGGNLYRTASTALTTTAKCPISGAKIAANVDCANTNFTLSDSGNALNRNALVSMRLTLQDSSATETVTLQHEVHVDNTP